MVDDLLVTRPIAEASLRRLPLYHRYLETLKAQGAKYVSCPEIGLALKADPTQVRKDLEAAGITGRPKVGYELDVLLAGITDFLGWNNTNEAFLVGAGHLGEALLGYPQFSRCGLNIVASFENDPAKIGTRLRGKEVLAIETLPELARRMHVHIGIITVPATAAQKIADLMVEGGIRAIWNFAPVQLVLPQDVILHNEDLYCSLASLSRKLADLLRREAQVKHLKEQTAVSAAYLEGGFF
ncbi:MAG TPA: redox-sensing transcriptional repressor Rex [Tepidisphaeraceae bacterium]|nr:redox-sensing transcriptional repressor Rex [Tepidisphaeraceae bacterium]